MIVFSIISLIFICELFTQFAQLMLRGFHLIKFATITMVECDTKEGKRDRGFFNSSLALLTLFVL